MNYCTKATLHKNIGYIRKYIFGLSEKDYPLNMVEFCKNLGGINIGFYNFSTQQLRGMAYVSSTNNENDVILLNGNLTFEEQNYYCGHEFIHVLLHRGEEGKHFSCYEKTMPNQNSILEWQANEGSAEFLMPYKMMFPLVKSYIEKCGSNLEWTDLHDLKVFLAGKFNVTETVAKYRLESLKYELNQFLNGRDLSDLDFLSLRQQKRSAISVKSLNDIEDNLYFRWFSAWRSKTTIA